MHAQSRARPFSPCCPAVACARPPCVPARLRWQEELHLAADVASWGDPVTVRRSAAAAGEGQAGQCDSRVAEALPTRCTHKRDWISVAACCVLNPPLPPHPSPPKRRKAASSRLAFALPPSPLHPLCQATHRRANTIPAPSPAGCSWTHIFRQRTKSLSVEDGHCPSQRPSACGCSAACSSACCRGQLAGCTLHSCLTP